MEDLCKEYEPLRKAFDTFRLQTEKQNKTLPLDYIMVLPTKISNQLMKMTTELTTDLMRSEHGRMIAEENKRRRMEFHMTAMTKAEAQQFIYQRTATKTQQLKHFREFLKLTNIFKNNVMKKFLKIKAEKSKMTIKQSVELMIKKKQEAEAKKKRKIKKKIERQTLPDVF